MNTFRTTDIVLAASLRTNGFVMSGIEVVGNRGTFVFKDVNQSFLDDYDLGKVSVEPVGFNNCVKQLTTSVRRQAQGK